MRGDRCSIVMVSALVSALSLAGVGLAHGDDLSSSCGPATVNDSANDCYTVTPPMAGTIEVNGTEGTTENWNGAVVKNLVGDLSGEVKMLRAIDAVYLFITVDDSTYNPSDSVSISTDPFHDLSSVGEDVTFRIVRDVGDSPGHTKTIGGVQASWPPAADSGVAGLPFLGVTSTSTSWVVEVKLTASELGLSDLSPIIGLGIQVEDADTGSLATWPANFDDQRPEDTWANLKTRYPIKYMIVLDQSGSMLSQNKWNDAKKAANFLANAVSIFRDPTYFDDKMGIVTFSWNNSTNTDSTSVPKPLAAIEAFPLGNYTDKPPTVAAPLSQNFTPIGKGLNAAFNAVGIGSEETQRVVLLISDGLHNRPSDEVPLKPTDLSYRPCSIENWGAGCDSSEVQVNTVALGQDWGVDTALLTNIKNAYAGEFASTYNITTDVEELKEIFISSLEDLYGMNLAYDAGYVAGGFDVNANERRAVVILSWTDPSQAREFRIQQKANDSLPWPPVTDGEISGEVSCSASAVDTTVGFAVCIVENPPSGKWRAVDDSGMPITAFNRQFVVLDLNLRARFGIGHKVHGTGQEVILTADLKEAGLPVTDDPTAHPVKVTVQIRRPAEGFGTYVSTHTPTSCDEAPPTLPPIEKDTNPILIATAARSATTSPSGQPSGSDPTPARFEKIEQLFRLCQKDGLIYVEEPGQDLYDDGTHGDETPNDGVYTLRFTNTEYEGSYIFRFKAVGKSPSGSTFSRVRTMADYLRVEVDPAPANTAFEWREYQRSGNTVVTQVYVIPRDRFKGYLGPGYPDQVKFTTTAGALVGPVIDHNNGIYSQYLRYDSATERPKVSADVQGKQLRPIRAYRAFELVLPFVGASYLDTKLNIDPGVTIGAKFGYALTSAFTAQLEAGATLTRSTGGDFGAVAQFLANVCYNVRPLSVGGRLTPFLTVGGGYVRFIGLGRNDGTFAAQAGAGVTLAVTNSIGVRVDGRVLRLGSLPNVGPTTFYQGTAGLVFGF